MGRDSRGYDAGKKVNGRKRFIITDTTGLLVTVAVMAASWQDHDGAKTALLSAYLTTPIRHVSPTRASRDGSWTGPATRCAPLWRLRASPPASAASASSPAE
ncbi:Mobile element protein [[Actinomadura] parvosata subsp. kistnae]|nr:Mobile element protein [Actinomadura parvosata subsp. kistnae]